MDKVDELIEKLAKDIIDKMNKDLPVVQQIKALAELINARAIHSTDYFLTPRKPK
ncbi:MAG: hypothetical protein NC393_08275 [Clostridium sp.]|nr:hypothetical protein [Clostridium sp.]MCM1208985.1 hypothetical protein [Ruminococcus sp.]